MPKADLRPRGVLIRLDDRGRSRFVPSNRELLESTGCLEQFLAVDVGVDPRPDDPQLDVDRRSGRLLSKHALNEEELCGRARAGIWPTALSRSGNLLSAGSDVLDPEQRDAPVMHAPE